jgi:hypothetical protein
MQPEACWCETQPCPLLVDPLLPLGEVRTSTSKAN